MIRAPTKVSVPIALPLKTKNFSHNGCPRIALPDKRHFPHWLLRILANDRNRLVGAMLKRTPVIFSRDAIEVLLYQFFLV
jgi:hypothetical protein